MNARWRHGLLAVAIALLIAVIVDMANSVMRRPTPVTELVGDVYRGGKWSLADHRGKHPILFSFFATWCGPCRAEHPHLVELQKKYGSKGVQIILLTQEDSSTIDLDPDFSKTPLTIITGADVAWQAFNVDMIPRTIVFDAKGDIQVDSAGFNTAVIRRIDNVFAGRKNP